MRRLIACAALAACGHTQVHADDPRARIFADGEFIGRGDGELRQIGPPGSKQLVAKADDGRHATRVIKRRFTLSTFIVGLFTYATGFIWAWQYPDEVTLSLGAPPVVAGDPWAATGDAWSAPPPGWSAPPVRAAAKPAAAPAPACAQASPECAPPPPPPPPAPPQPPPAP